MNLWNSLAQSALSGVLALWAEISSLMFVSGLPTCSCKTRSGVKSHDLRFNHHCCAWLCAIIDDGVAIDQCCIWRRARQSPDWYPVDGGVLRSCPCQPVEAKAEIRPVEWGLASTISAVRTRAPATDFSHHASKTGHWKDLTSVANGGLFVVKVQPLYIKSWVPILEWLRVHLFRKGTLDDWPNGQCD